MSARDVWWARSANLDPEKLARRGLTISGAKTGAFGSPAERFFDKTVMRGGCLVWTGGADENGYGLFRPNGRRGPTTRAHRWSLERELGRPIGEGLFACHTCDVPACVLFDHLYEGTAQDNADDRDGRGSATERREKWLITCGL